jgi:hypothetical protein
VNRNQLIAICYRYFRQGKQLPVDLYVTLTSQGINVEALRERYEETQR